MGDDSNGTIDDALELLRQGKQLEKDSQFWDAAEKFIRGRSILQSLAASQARDTEEDRQIAALYEEKSTEYLLKSRKTIIEAMKLEVNEKEELFFEELSTSEAENRNHIFMVLFSKELDLGKTDESNAINQQWSIEERLQELNASLPSGFKTDDERLDSINRGLNRLGLSLYSQKKPFENFQDAMPKSEDEQIEEIMAQAKDEVALNKQIGVGPSTVTSANVLVQNSDDDDDDSEVDSNAEDAGDLELSDEQLAIKHIRRRVVQSQRKLAELVAILGESAKSQCADIGIDDDDDDHSEVSFKSDLLASGRKKLKSAQRDLRKALEEWNEELRK